MQPTRRAKNLVLCGANVLLLLIVVSKFVFTPETVPWQIKTWMFIAPMVVVAVLFTPSDARFAAVAHALIFLSSGAALGLTLGALFRAEDSVTIAEKIWLPVGLAAAVLHYWPSTNDEYR